MKRLRDVPTVPSVPTVPTAPGQLMSVLASQPLKEAPAMASAASAVSTAPSSPAYVRPRGQLHGDALEPRVLGSRKAVKDEEISEPCKIEGISMVLDADSRGSDGSGQRTSGQTKEQTMSMKREKKGKKGKRGEETQPSTASFVAPKQHTAVLELQEDPRKPKTSGVIADVQTVSKNRRGKTNRKGGEKTQPSTASAANAEQHSSRPELQEDAKELSTSGAVEVQTGSTNRGSAEMGKKELGKMEETSPSDPASDFAQRVSRVRPSRSKLSPVQRLCCTASIFLPMALGTESR